MSPAYLDDPDLADSAFSSLFAEMHAQGERPPIAVGPALQRIFDGHGTVRPRRKSHIGRGPLIGLVVTGTVAGGIGAAAADELPRPLQRAVSTVLNTVTPFSIPTGSEPKHADAPAAPKVDIPPASPHGAASKNDGDEDAAGDDGGDDTERDPADDSDDSNDDRSASDSSSEHDEDEPSDGGDDDDDESAESEDGEDSTGDESDDD